MSCLVTVGIAFFNAEKYLDYAILSVINQSVDNWKLILMNDGSTDRSLEIAKQYTSCSNVILIDDSKQKGLSIRLNQIADLADTPYLARMDADDIMHPKRLEKQLIFLHENPEIDLVGTKIISIDNQNIPYGIRGSLEIPKSRKEALKRSVFNHPTVLGKTRWFLENRYRDDYWRLEDYDLWYRTVESSNFAVLDESLLYYREVNIPYLRKYLQSSRSMRRFFREKREAIGSKLMIRMIFVSLIKDTIYLLFNIFGREQYLVKRRSECLPASEIEEHLSIINSVVKR
ncbi:glycosyltransferase [Desertivirga arenae]|uniref:glycosyltransferase n=1 Tax=Desertivirga arenae TaxID=2810309 RepID=UPI001A9707DC|nr:glycosyltransferase [Pedobacter sp. SYSU D00823]